MRTGLRQALFDPASFFAGDGPSRRVTAAVLGLTGLSVLAPIPLVFVLIERTATDAGVPGGVPTLVYAAGESSIAVPGYFAVIVGLAVGTPLLALAIYGLLFHGLTWPVADAGSVRETAALVGVGLLPQTLGNLAVVALLYLAYPIAGFDTGIGITFPARVVAPVETARSPWVAVEVFGALTVVWSAWVWMEGLRTVRGLSRRAAALIGGVVLLLTLALTPPLLRMILTVLTH
ncbi:hypothetical protein GCM10028857_28130 [Salinarchaeum chitinilyticum]